MTELATEGGLKSLYAQQRGDLLRFLVARAGNREEAEDVLQEMWIKLAVFQSGPIANGRAYLFRMAHNLVLDRLRERRRRERREQVWTDGEIGIAPDGMELADPARTPEEALADGDEARRIAEAIDTLPEGARRAFRLHKIEGLSHSEVALMLGISKSGVEKHMAVAMKYLRRALAAEAGDQP